MWQCAVVSSTTVILPLERSRWFRNERNELSITKHPNEIIRLTLDWGDMALASGETVSTAAYTDSGVTRTLSSVSGNTTIATFEGTGYTEINITTSASRELIQRVNFYPIDGRIVGDYR